MTRELDFERPVLELERQLDELRRMAAGRDPLAVVEAGSLALPRRRASSRSGSGKAARDGQALEAQIEQLEERARSLKEQIFSGLSRWQVVQVARHPQRPYTLDYIGAAFSDFIELHGDRRFSDDPAIVAGIARLHGDEVVVVGQQKGRTTNENLIRNFGMPRPEGYRKALRVMRLAERFRLPIVTLIDTPGAYPGLGAEERGQSQAIAEALEGMASLTVPIVSAVIGEGGSGGALAIGVADRVLMMEFSIYSVISPEGCASILFKDASYAEAAAESLRITAPDLAELGVIDAIVKEPLGGAHRDPAVAASRLGDAIHAHLSELSRLDGATLCDRRYEKFRRLGAHEALVLDPLKETNGEAEERTRKPRARSTSHGRKRPPS